MLEYTMAQPMSIAVADWNVSLQAQALLSEAVMEDNVQAVFDLRITPTELNSLFSWNLSASPNAAKFATGAKATFLGYCKDQLAIPAGDTVTSRSTVVPSLSTHFLLTSSKLPLSPGMGDTSTGIGGLERCNMIEEKVLAVSHDLFNSTSAFTLFEPNSRYLLAKDYYIRGKHALEYIGNQFTDRIATEIVSRILAQRPRPDNSDDSTFDLFVEGDELTFNVAAVSSASQYDIIPNSQVNKNLADRHYKFKIVANGDTTPYVGRNITYSTVNVMGHGTTNLYSNIFAGDTVVGGGTTSYNIYIDSGGNTTTYSTAGITLVDGTQKF